MLKIQAGFSLSGMLISMATGLTLIATSASLIASVKNSQQRQTSALLLEDEMVRVTSLLRQQLRESGKTGNYLQTLIQSGNPDTTFTSKLVSGAYGNEPAGSCIIYASDLNLNGVIDSHPVNERRGFRLRSKALETRINGRTCTQSGWQDITDPNFVTVSQFTVSLDRKQQTTDIAVSLAMSLKTAGDISRQNTFIVTVYHD
ncbi:MAG: hypothetical protein CL587_15750 [Alteromonadaceae bacterium]|nr:hypothetical protein [Alteromonadaceae bacterium]